MKTLILFSTRDGQTREIASYLASELKELGIQTDVANVHRIEEPQWEIMTVWSLVLLFAMVTTTLRSRNLSKTCDATEFDAERLLFRKPGGAQTGEAYSTDQQLRAEVSDELAMASRSLRGHCRGAALPTLSLVRPFYDQADYEDVRR